MSQKIKLKVKSWLGFIYLKVLKCQFLVYILISYSERKQISQYACPKKRDMRSKLANNQVLKPVACRKSPKSYDSQHVCDIWKIDYYFLNKNKTLIECLLTCLWSSNRRYLIFICKIWDAFYILQTIIKYGGPHVLISYCQKIQLLMIKTEM